MSPPPSRECEPIIWPSRCRQPPALSLVTAAGALPWARGDHTVWETHTQAEELGEHVPPHLVPHREQCSVTGGPFQAGSCCSCSFTWNKSRACPSALLYCRGENHLETASLADGTKHGLLLSSETLRAGAGRCSGASPLLCTQGIILVSSLPL